MIRVDPVDHRQGEGQGWEPVTRWVQNKANQAAPVQVFLHGPAVTPGAMAPLNTLQTLDQMPSVTVTVCQAAWQRLGLNREPPLAVASLVELWANLSRAQHIGIWGRGEWPASSADWPRVAEPAVTEDAAWGLMVAHAPDQADRQSLLELALAAAVLELDVVVGFGPAATEELSGETGQRWAQLTDHRLAGIITQASEDDRYHERRWLVV